MSPFKYNVSKAPAFTTFGETSYYYPITPALTNGLTPISIPISGGRVLGNTKVRDFTVVLLFTFIINCPVFTKLSMTRSYAAGG